MYKRQPITAYV